LPRTLVLIPMYIDCVVISCSVCYFTIRHSLIFVTKGKL
jgi:hypothetical protein